MFEGIDLFSDTVTRPSPGMRAAIAQAVVGDEQMALDPTTSRLEEQAALLLGQERALFFPSATMANQVAILAQTERGDEIIAAQNAHILISEAGGPAAHAGVMTRGIPTEDGFFDESQLKQARGVRVGYLRPATRMVLFENTTNFGGGLAWPMEKLRAVTQAARALDLSLHLDGSRVLNAATRHQCRASEIGSLFDTVTLCLSKGLGCPAGAILAFKEPLFPKIRLWKQRMGGSLRQSGILAAAALYAFENNIRRLQDDHDNAALLTEGLKKIPGLRVEEHPLSTNMVYFSLDYPNADAGEFIRHCEERGVRFSQMGEKRIRSVTHLDVNRDQILSAIKILEDICRKRT